MSATNVNVLKIEANRWSSDFPIQSVENLSEILYRDKLWKTFCKKDALRDIDSRGSESVFWEHRNNLEAYPLDFFIFGQNPFDLEFIYILCTAESCQNTTSTLENLFAVYVDRARRTKIRQPRKWQNLGSEKEIEGEYQRTDGAKISVEWVGNLEKRLGKVKFVNAGPENMPNGYVEFIPNKNDKIIKIKKKIKLDVSVQVNIRKKSTGTRTNGSEMTEEFVFNNDFNIPNDGTGGTIETELRTKEEKNVSNNDGGGTGSSRYNGNTSLNYHKSFINMEKRTKQISSIEWHPTKLGFVAISYIDEFQPLIISDQIIKESQQESSSFPFPLLQTVPCKTMNESDMNINESVFNAIIANKIGICNAKLNSNEDDSDFGTGSMEEQSEDEEANDPSNARSFSATGCHIIYKEDSVTEVARTLSTENVESDCSNINFTQFDTQWLSEFLNNIERKDTNSHHSELDQPFTAITKDLIDEDTTSGESFESESSITSLTSTKKSDPVHKVPVYEDISEEYLVSVSDDLPISDTDSLVLLWDCENDLAPMLNLRGVHQVNIVKFYPRDGSLLAGGSCNGQLIIWDMEDGMNKANSRREQPKYNDDIVMEFAPDILDWDASSNHQCLTLHSIATSERNVSHTDKITALDWIHPSLKFAPNGIISKTESDHRSKQIITSSSDGTIKIWEMQIICTPPLVESGSLNNSSWNLVLTYSINVTNPAVEKYTSSVGKFVLTLPSIRYLSKSVDSYEMHCKHDWWTISHDQAVTSLCQNYFFPNIILSTGGRILALWNTNFNVGRQDGPIWWKQYPSGVMITHGCFTPFHPGLVYITKTNGNVDVWNMTKRINEPIIEINASGYQISAVAVVTPPYSQYQLSVADTNGVFHILNNLHDLSWSEYDFECMRLFLKRAEDSRKQFTHWNRYWKDPSTITDECHLNASHVQ